MPTFLQPGDWLVKINLSLACFHLPIKEAHRCFLSLSNRQLRFFLRNHLPTVRPRIIAPVLRVLHEWGGRTSPPSRCPGSRVPRRLLTGPPGPLGAVSARAIALNLLRFLGWRINGPALGPFIYYVTRLGGGGWWVLLMLRFVKVGRGGGPKLCYVTKKKQKTMSTYVKTYERKKDERNDCLSRKIAGTRAIDLFNPAFIADCCKLRR